jgi:hypothetical protein
LFASEDFELKFQDIKLLVKELFDPKIKSNFENFKHSKQDFNAFNESRDLCNQISEIGPLSYIFNEDLTSCSEVLLINYSLIVNEVGNVEYFNDLTNGKQILVNQLCFLIERPEAKGERDAFIATLGPIFTDLLSIRKAMGTNEIARTINMLHYPFLSSS